MKIVVLKFGGTSVGTTDKIKKVAGTGYKKRILNYCFLSDSGVTNELIKKSTEISDNFQVQSMMF